MNISAFIGDTVIDLTKAQIPYGETKINISSFIGDVKVFVPEDMDLGVTVTTNSFIGDMSLLNQNGVDSSAVPRRKHPITGKQEKGSDRSKCIYRRRQSK